MLLSKIYSNCIFNKVILLGFYYLIIKNEFIAFNLNFKIDNSIELYKYRFFKRHNSKIT